MIGMLEEVKRLGLVAVWGDKLDAILFGVGDAFHFLDKPKAV